MSALLSSSPSSLDSDPFLKDLTEKRQSFRNNVAFLAAELKEARLQLASQEQSFAHERDRRMMVEMKARSMEEEVGRLQTCLEERDFKLSASMSAKQQHLKDLDDLRSHLSTIQAVAEANAELAQSTQIYCLNLSNLLDENNALLLDHEKRITELEEQLDLLHNDLHARKLSRSLPREDVLITEKEIMHVLEIAATKDCDDRNILTEVSLKHLENNINNFLTCKDEEVAKSRDNTEYLSAHCKTNAEELDSQIDKHKADQEWKRRVMRLDFCLQQARTQIRKLQTMAEKKDDMFKEFRDELDKKNVHCTSCNKTQNFWESSDLKFLASMSMLLIIVLIKRRNACRIGNAGQKRSWWMQILNPLLSLSQMKLLDTVSILFNASSWLSGMNRVTCMKENLYCSI